MKKNLNLLVYILMLIVVFSSCSGNDEFYAPKPRGYFRIDLPEKEYIMADTIFPFKFQYPKYAFINIIDNQNNKNWFNLSFPDVKGKLHFSYKEINDNLYQYTEDTYNFVYKHVPKAEEISYEEIKIPEKRVFSLIYYIEGVDAASPIQFYITDSTKNFIRGALYFEHIPNNDSIAPIIEFINEDIINLIETWEWKN